MSWMQNAIRLDNMIASNKQLHEDEEYLRHSAWKPNITMARSKVKLAWIANDAARRATYKKRKAGIWKKLREISILCGVKACSVVYGSANSIPEAWPGIAEAASMLSEFLQIPEIKRSRKMFNQERFARERISKTQQQLEKSDRVIMERRLELLLNRCLASTSAAAASAGSPASKAYYTHYTKMTNGLSVDVINNIVHLIDRKMRVIEERVQSLIAKQPMAVADVGSLQQPLPRLPKPQFLLPQLPPALEVRHVNATGMEMDRNQIDTGFARESKMTATIGNDMTGQANVSSASVGVGVGGTAVLHPVAGLYDSTNSNFCVDHSTMLLDMMKSSQTQMHQEGPSGIWFAMPSMQLATMGSEMVNPLLFSVDSSRFHPNAGVIDGFLNLGLFVPPEHRSNTN